MSVKSFKFVSPGVFINEIDNSFIPKSADAIGPVVIGRARRGPAMTPVKVQSYSEFVQMFGDTVPGNAGGDIYRDGNLQSPMYGTYAAKAFLRSNVAPLTYIRLLGEQHEKATSTGYNGWKTTKNAATTLKENGGAYGLWIWKSGSQAVQHGNLGTGTLGAIFYVNASGGVALSGTMVGKNDASYAYKTAALGAVIDSSTGVFTLLVTGSGTAEKINFSFDDTQENFIRKVCNTNPQLTTTANEFYPSASVTNYWLGETFEQQVRDGVSQHALGRLSVAAATEEPLASAPGTDITASTVVITDYNGDSTTYAFCSASKGEVDGGTGVLTGFASGYADTTKGVQLVGTGSAATLAGYLVAAINNTTYGQGNTIKATDLGGGALSVTQLKPGSSGNTTITPTNNVKGGDATAAHVTVASSFVLGAGSVTGELAGGGNTLVSTGLFGTILPLVSGSTVSAGPHVMNNIRPRAEGKTGWFVGQQLGTAGNFVPEKLQKLFRLVGRGHGEWLQKNVKISIEKIRQSNSTVTDYGTFSVVLRSLQDTDSNVVVMERFDNCTLDPASPNYVARVIGDKYAVWDTTDRMLKTYGEYDNQSKFIYVEMDATVEAGASGLETLLPFGYYGPPKPRNIIGWNGWSKASSFVTGAGASTARQFLSVYTPGTTGCPNLTGASDPSMGQLNGLSASLRWPALRLRLSASDGGLADQTNAYFGIQTTRDASSTTSDASVGDYARMWWAGQADDPTGYGVSDAAAMQGYGYIFTMDDIVKGPSNVYYYASGSRKNGYSVSAGGNYKTLIDAGYDRFTAPIWGGIDGLDIHYPDPLYNRSMTEGSSNELNSYVYNSYKRAIDTVADPEVVDMNLFTSPGLTFDALTTHMVRVSAERADTLALIDLKNVYVPAHEQYNTTKAARLQSTPTQAANLLKSRQIDSSYGCTFYPWVQGRDEQTGRLLWMPPSVAMMGVLASSQAKSDVWFAPAGFNRGGLSDGAAGIPISGVTTRLTSKQRDVLYEARINPIASFPSSGIVVFGQKTLQERQSALDRINVRRLVIYLKKQISILSTRVLFEQNVQATWNRFKSLIEPFLANVKVQFGITDYKLILDESTTTPDLIDQNILYAKIMIKPARAIEYIAIDFVVASTGASFDD